MNSKVSVTQMLLRIPAKKEPPAGGSVASHSGESESEDDPREQQVCVHLIDFEALQPALFLPVNHYQFTSFSAVADTL